MIIITNNAENVEVRQLIKTKNVVFDKLMTAFSVVLDEMASLTETAELKYYPVLSMFGEDVKEDGEEEGDSALQVSRILPLLRDLGFFLNRCYALVKNLVQQLACLYHEKERLYISSFKHIHMMRVWEGMARFFTMIITIDAMHVREGLEEFLVLVVAIEDKVEDIETDDADKLEALVGFVHVVELGGPGVKVDVDALEELVAEDAVVAHTDNVGHIELLFDAVLEHKSVEKLALDGEQHLFKLAERLLGGAVARGVELDRAEHALEAGPSVVERGVLA